MNVDKTQILRMAIELGADDAAVVGADEIPGKSVIVLFSRYFAAPKPQNYKMTVSPYYIASNRGYHAAKKLTEHLVSLGANAQHDTEIDPKVYALKHGGHIGKNGFYYHPKFGSMVNLQTIVTDCVIFNADVAGTTKCLDCGACFAACPSDGVDNVQNCLRYHSNSLIPQHLRGDLYQLFGCERCQTACPQNSAETKEVPCFCTGELIAGMHTDELTLLAGVNTARKMRIVSQAAIYAANTGLTDLIGALEALAQNAPSPVCEHALYAAKILRGGPHD
jgi:epoxyqueuosine reductase QueG